MELVPTLILITVLGQIEAREAPVLLQRVVVSQDEMDRWPVDRPRSGEQQWAESTWGTGPLEGPDRRLFNWNVWPCRVVFRVDESQAAAPVLRGEAEWRRSSLSIRMKGLKLVAPDGQLINDARLVHYDQARVVIDFRPAAGPGSYHLYYAAHEQVCFEPAESWLTQAEQAVEPPQADPLRIEARCAIEAFDDMEVIALAGEVEDLLAKYPESPYLVFPEDRDRSIKLRFEIPAGWALNGPMATLTLDADRNEYRPFQLGLWGCRAGLDDVDVVFSDLKGAGGIIEASRLQCLTLESRCKSRYIAKPSGPFPVPEGEVRALWCGIDIPEDAAAGAYEGMVTVRPKANPAVGGNERPNPSDHYGRGGAGTGRP